jgi:endoglucanase
MSLFTKTAFAPFSFALAFGAPALLEACDTPQGDDVAAFDRDSVDQDTGATDSGFDEDAARRRPGTGAFAGKTLYVESSSNASRQAAAWRTSDPVGAAYMDVIAAQQSAIWLGDWTSNPSGTVDAALDRAGSALQVLVVYNIPHRDCGAWSSGGAADGTAYASFISSVASGLQGRQAIIVLEPDGLPLTTCLSASQLTEREALMSSAVDKLTAAGGKVYLDAGDSNWISAATMAPRLKAAGIGHAAGFSLNVSHTETTTDSVAYANELRALVGTTAHFVVDTGRNGLGPSADNAWCNPLGLALGHNPTVNTSIAGLDGLLWIKPPGESDGSCNGGPVAGAWWADYARDLAETRATM